LPLGTGLVVVLDVEVIAVGAEEALAVGGLGKDGAVGEEAGVLGALVPVDGYVVTLVAKVAGGDEGVDAVDDHVLVVGQVAVWDLDVGDEAGLGGVEAALEVGEVEVVAGLAVGAQVGLGVIDGAVGHLGDRRALLDVRQHVEGVCVVESEAENGPEGLLDVIKVHVFVEPEAGGAVLTGRGVTVEHAVVVLDGRRQAEAHVDRRDRVCAYGTGVIAVVHLTLDDHIGHEGAIFSPDARKIKSLALLTAGETGVAVTVFDLQL
jgi:hypothetical protein